VFIIMYELEHVNGIGKAIVERMKANGIDSIEKLASIDIKDLLEIKGIGKLTAEKYIEDAKKMLEDKKSEVKPEINGSFNEKDEINQDIKDIEYLMPSVLKELPEKKNSIPNKPVVKPIPSDSREKLVIEIEREIEKVKNTPKENLFNKEVTIEAFNAVDRQGATNQSKSKNEIQLKKVKVPPKPITVKKQKPIEKKHVKRIKEKGRKKRKTTSKPSVVKEQKLIDRNHVDRKKETDRNKVKKQDKKPFFREEVAQKIRFLHFKIKKIEEQLDKKEIDFSVNDLNIISEYLSILNIDYKREKRRKIILDLDITSSYIDYGKKKIVEIYDLMLECARALWIIAKAFERLSKKFETAEEEWENAIITMSESAKYYKAAAYFSTAAIHQHDKGRTLDAENLELKSEEVRANAQKIAAEKEEIKKNYNLASSLYAGLSVLSKRIYYMKKYDIKRGNLLKAKFNYEIGRACHLRAKAIMKSPIQEQNGNIVMKLQQKANYYFFQAEEIWENMLKNNKKLTLEEKEDLSANLSKVNNDIIENEVEILEFDKVKKIQDPEPIIIIPENLAPVIPKCTEFMTRYAPKDANVKRYKKYNVKKIEERITYSKKEQLLIKKVAILRTINVLEGLFEKNEIDVEKFIELMETYSIKQEEIEQALENLEK